MTTWDERVKAVAIARRQWREADAHLFEEIWRYLNDRQDEDEFMRRDTLPDGRQEGSKYCYGMGAFAYHVRDGKVFVRAGWTLSFQGTDGKIVRLGGDESMEPFDNLEAAYERMAELMCDLKQPVFALKEPVFAASVGRKRPNWRFWAGSE